MVRRVAYVILAGALFTACSHPSVVTHQPATVDGYVSPAFASGATVGFTTDDAISAALAAALGKRGYRIIERAHLDAVIDEQALGQSGLTKDQQVVKAGQISNVRFLITVSDAPLVDKYGNPHPDKPVTVTVKIVDAQSAEVVGALTYTNVSRGSSGSKSDVRHKESGTEAARAIAEYIDRATHH